MKQAVIYARYSSDRQTEQSIEGQLTVCNKYASDNDILVVDQYIGMAEYYSAELSQKIRRGMKESRSKGQTTGGYPRFGYRVENKKFIIDEAIAPLIVEMFQRYSNGESAKQIADDFKERGIKNSQGNSLIPNSILKSLRNIRYVGRCERNGEIFDNIMPRIISDELFDNVQESLNYNTKKAMKKRAVGKYLLTGKLTCAYCGVLMTSESGTGKHGEAHYYYKCATIKRKKGTCEKKTLNRNWLENLVINITLEEIKKLNMIEDIARTAIELHQNEQQENSFLSALKSNLASIKKSIGNIVKAIEDGIYTNSTVNRLKELEAEELKIKHAIELEQARSFSFLTKDMITAFLYKIIDGAPDSEEFRQQLIDTLINTIVIYNDKIVIHYNYTENRNKKGTTISNALVWGGSTKEPVVEVRGVEPLCWKATQSLLRV